MDKSTEDAIHESIVRKLKQHSERNKEAAALADLIGVLSTDIITRLSKGFPISDHGKLTKYGELLMEVVIRQKDLINKLKALYTEVK